MTALALAASPASPPPQAQAPAAAASAPLLPAALASLAYGLSQDAAMGVEVGEAWSFDMQRRVLSIAASDLRERGADVCGGIVAHEIGHALVSRYLSFPVTFPHPRLGMLVLNGIEDPRVERWIVRRFPGVAAWLRAARSDGSRSLVGQPSLYAFVLACAHEGAHDFAPYDHDLPPGVATALERTRDARRRYADCAPPGDLGVADPVATARRYLQELHGVASDCPWPPPPREQAVRLSAWDALRIAEAEILPEAAALYLRDRDACARGLAALPELVEALRRALSQGRRPDLSLRELLERGGGGQGDPGCSLRELAEALLGALAPEAQRPPLLPAVTAMPARPGPPPAAGPPAHRSIPPLIGSALPYDQALAEVRHQVEELTQRLDAMLRPRRRLGLRAGYPSGQRLDVRRAMAWDADPRRWSELWMRPSVPERRRVLIGLLIDLSGSMSGARVRHAQLGAVLLVETLQRLEVDFAVDGFQDERIPLCAAGEGLTEDARARLGAMAQEVDGCRPGGHNRPAHNDDGPCLAEFAAAMAAWPAEERVVIVVSDGSPEGSRSDADDLRRTIAALTAPGTDVRLIGLGLGPGTGHVAAFYPDHRADVPLAGFADAIAATLARVLAQP